LIHRGNLSLQYWKAMKAEAIQRVREYDKLQAEVKRLREALCQYANKDNWKAWEFLGDGTWDLAEEALRQ